MTKEYGHSTKNWAYPHQEQYERRVILEALRIYAESYYEINEIDRDKRYMASEVRFINRLRQRIEDEYVKVQTEGFKR